jgi:IS4 transposase
MLFQIKFYGFFLSRKRKKILHRNPTKSTMENKMRNLKSILTKFEEIVSPKVCNDLVRQSRLVQRSTSRLQGYEFAQAMMIPNGFLEAETLNSLAVRMQRTNKTCNLSASALAQRINTQAAVRFMKFCFETVLKEIVRKEITSLTDLPNLSCFKHILIQDSSRMELHEKLSPYFKGSGGVASKASIKFDYIFDYLSEQAIDVEFYSGNKPDQSLANRLIPMIGVGDLVIRDLGYFIIDSLVRIEEKGAFYVSRWKVNEDVYESKDATVPLKLDWFLSKHTANGLADVQVFIGKKRHPVRLIACQLDEEVINKKRREANRAAKRRGTQISQKKCALLQYCIFITNVPPTMLSSKSTMAIYRARWRIEIIFKQWKSCLKIDIFKGHNKERLYCFLYGRLIMILLVGALCQPLMRYAFELGRELSCYKLTKYLIADHILARAIQENTLEEFLEKLLENIPKRLCMDKRKNFSLRQNVRTGRSYYNELDKSYLDEKVA